MNDLLPPYNTPFNFEFITQLILDTQRVKYKIKKEWEKIYRFLDDFPEYALNLDNINLKPEFLIDSHQKVYRQMLRLSDTELLEQKIFDLYFYEYDPTLFQRWQEEHVEVGKSDSKGLLNTGCCVIVRVVKVDATIYANQYFGLCN